MSANKGHTGQDYEEAFQRLGDNYAVAREFGVNESTVRRARERLKVDPAIQAGMKAIGTDMVPNIAWVKTKATADVPGYSMMLKSQAGIVDFKAEISGAIKDSIAALHDEIALPRRFDPQDGNLLVLDPADVHILKLSMKSETGYSYDENVAEHRLVEGSRVLMEWGVTQGVTRVLFVMGNDILHIDTPKRTTTSGTPQDTSSSLFNGWRVARRAYARIVKMGLEMGLHMDLVHIPSNHDWVLGWTVAQTIGALFEDHPNVGASEYYLSEIHRKYYRFGTNLIGLTHGDGIKEANLGDAMRTEARSHISECPHLYWYLHHLHHKIRKGIGVRPRDREKDHIGMTVLKSAAGEMEGDNVQVEYIRSPSPPDGWHHRNGYINRQAVEAFVHHPHDGQVSRRTAWF